MNNLSKNTILNLLLKKEGDSFELGRYYFSALSPDEKEALKRQLNETSLNYFYTIIEGGITRTDLV
jgi:hypothetical protein